MKEKTRLAKMFLLAEEVHRYGSLESRLPDGAVERIKGGKTRSTVEFKKVDSEHPISRDKLHYSYGL